MGKKAITSDTFCFVRADNALLLECSPAAILHHIHSAYFFANLCGQMCHNVLKPASFFFLSLSPSPCRARFPFLFLYSAHYTSCWLHVSQEFTIPFRFVRAYRVPFVSDSGDYARVNTIAAIIETHIHTHAHARSSDIVVAQCSRRDSMREAAFGTTEYDWLRNARTVESTAFLRMHTMASTATW